MKIFDLRDCPGFVETLAAWDFGHWGFRRDYSSYEMTVQHYKDACKKEFPKVYVVVDQTKKLPMGMTSLMMEDIHAPSRPEYSPYLVSLYIQERFRNKGVAKALIEHTELITKRLGHKSLYINTRNAYDLFQKIGWETLDKVFNKPKEKELFLMRKFF